MSSRSRLCPWFRDPGARLAAAVAADRGERAHLRSGAVHRHWLGTFDRGSVDGEDLRSALAARDAFAAAVRSAIAEHHRAGRSVVVERGGELTWLPPQEKVKHVRQ